MISIVPVMRADHFFLRVGRFANAWFVDQSGKPTWFFYIAKILSSMVRKSVFMTPLPIFVGELIGNGMAIDVFSSLLKSSTTIAPSLRKAAIKARIKPRRSRVKS